MDAQHSPEHPEPVVQDGHIAYIPAEKEGYWRKMGGGSLTISIVVHAVIILAALLWYIQGAMPPKEEPDFLAGGGGGSSGNTKVNEKMRRKMVQRTPSVRIAASGVGGSIVLPDTNSSVMDLSKAAQTSGRMSGTPGTGSGFGGGSGSGTGIGSGSGFGPGKGPGFTARFLGMETSGNNIIFCIDTSGSMGANLKAEGIAAVRRELNKAIESLPATAYFNLICFGQNGDIFKPKSVTASTESKQEAIAFMKGYFGGSDFGRTRTERYGKEGKDKEGISYVPLLPDDVKELVGTGGGSRIDLAMVAAFEREASTIFVLSDGAPGTVKQGESTPMDKGDLIDLIHEKYKVLLKERPLTVSTISVEAAGAEGLEGVDFLRKLARKFGGKHKEVKPAKL